MAQKITIKIASRSYTLNASSPEQERTIRIAAEMVTKQYNAAVSKFIGKSPEDILAFVALNDCIAHLSAKQKLDKAQQEEQALTSDVGNYLKNIV
ncbi:MAG: cell division protein ZapA [Bacteroidales bacterium]|nr:cell division protein ZapA [Bacteroidales bacterium]